MRYRDNMTPAEEKAFMAEVEAEDAAYVKAAEHDAAMAEAWAKAHPNGPTDEDLAAAEEAAYYEELNRGYARDRR